MRATWQLKEDAANYVKRHSWQARWAPKVASAMTAYAVELLVRVRGESHTREELASTLTAELSPGVWRVLRWLVPIVVRLVLNWWYTELELNRRTSSENFD